MYSCLPNTSRGWNNGIGWKFLIESINVGDGINVLGGKIFKNLTIVGGLINLFSFFLMKKSCKTSYICPKTTIYSF